MLRRILLKLHLAAGLAVALMLAIASVTGAIMIFRPGPLEAEATDDTAHPRLPLDEVVTRARAVHPHGQLDYVLFGPAVGKAVQVVFRGKDIVAIDAKNGAVMSSANYYTGWFGRAEQIHRLLFFGKTGKLVTGTSAILVVFLIVSGAWLWIPPTVRGLREGLQLDRRLTGRAWHRNVHKVVGFYAGGIVLLSAVTGISMAFEWHENGSYVGPGAGAVPAVPKSTVPAEGAKRQSVQALFDTVTRQMPGAREVKIYFPRKDSDAVQVQVVAREAPHAHARSFLFLDAYSGAVLRATPHEANTSGHKLYTLGRSLHLGHAGGVAWRVAQLVAVVAIPLLIITGIAMAWRRVATRARAAVPAGGAAALRVSNPVRQ